MLDDMAKLFSHILCCINDSSLPDLTLALTPIAATRAPLKPHSIYLLLYNHHRTSRSRHSCLYYRCTYCAKAFLQVRSRGHSGLNSKGRFNLHLAPADGSILQTRNRYNRLGFAPEDISLVPPRKYTNKRLCCARSGVGTHPLGKHPPCSAEPLLTVQCPTNILCQVRPIKRPMPPT
jgi:hypothetical protein